ncbi:MAG TPA: ATP-binding protein [Candidatus Aquicultor sp.]
MAGRRLTLLLPAKPQSLNAIRRQVEGFIQYTPFETRGGDILVVISEACTNVVRHAYVKDHDRPIITLGAELKSDSLVFVVCDKGKGLTLTDEAPVFSEDGGFGLFLIRRLTDRFECRSSATGTVLELAFENPDRDGWQESRKRKPKPSIRDVAAVFLVAFREAVCPRVKVLQRQRICCNSTAMPNNTMPSNSMLLGKK